MTANIPTCKIFRSSEFADWALSPIVLYHLTSASITSASVVGTCAGVLSNCMTILQGLRGDKLGNLLALLTIGAFSYISLYLLE